MPAALIAPLAASVAVAVGLSALLLACIGVLALFVDSGAALAWAMENPVAAYRWLPELFWTVPEEFRLLVGGPTFLMGVIAGVAVWRGAARRPGEWSDTTMRGACLIRADGSLRRWVWRIWGPWLARGRLVVGTVSVALESETHHFLLSGATGTGKSQIMDGFLRTIRQRGQRCLVIDHSGGFLARHARDGDVLLNPFDSRSLAWSPFAEIVNEYDYRRIANAIMPDPIDGAADKAEWIRYGQTFLSDVLKVMHRQGETDPAELHRWLTGASPDELRGLLDGTTSAIFSQKANARLLGSVRGVMTPYVRFLEHLPQTATPFSVRRWVSEERSGRWLFVTYKEDQLDELRQYLSCIASIAMVEALSLSESRDRRLWFILDELSSLGHLGRLPDTLTKLRKLGGCVVMAVQIVAQLRAIYGRDVSQAIIGNASTKVILRQEDGETAKLWEEQLGHRQVKRTIGGSSSNRSFNAGRNGRSESRSTQIVRESVVLASELMALRDLRGVVTRTGKPHAQFRHVFVTMRERCAGFEPPRLNQERGP